MNFALFLAPAVAAALVSFALTPLAEAIAIRLGAVDQPGPRKIHQTPVPRLGGLAVVAAIFIVAAATYWLLPRTKWTLPPHLLLGIGVGVLPIVVVSILDDIRALRPGPKFMAHVAGAAIAVWFGVSLAGEVHLFGQTLSIGWLAIPLSIIWIVGVTNAFNLIDGLDGLSAGLALISSLSLAGMFTIVGQTGMAAAVLVLAGALGGFLPRNIYPARMFLGDTGATAVGFCLAAFALKGGSTLSAGFATLLPVFVLGLPIAETFISMARRMLKRLLDRQDAGGVFQPDRNHMHHRLLALGVDHPRAVFILYGAGLLLAGAALVSIFLTTKEAALFVLALLLAGFLGVGRLGYDEFAVIRNGVVLRVYETPVLKKSMFVVFVDLMLVALGVYCAIVLKTDDWELREYRRVAFSMIAILTPITVTVFSRLGLYRGSWRVAGTDDYMRACCGVLTVALLGATVRMFLAPEAASLSLFSICALVHLLLVIGSRASYQILAASQWRARNEGTPALIYGAGRKGASAFRELVCDVETALRPVGFIDDDPSKVGKLVNGVPVVGSVRTLEAAIARFAARAVVVSSDNIPEPRLAEAHALCERLGVDLLKMQISFDQVGSAVEQRSPAPAAPAIADVMAGMAAEVVTPARAIASPATNVRFEPVPATPLERWPSVMSRPCPGCGSLKLHRSHSRSITERVRKKLTEKRPYRCQRCGWRGWSRMAEIAVYQPIAAPSQRVPMLDSIDAVIQRSSPGKLAI